MDCYFFMLKKEKGKKWKSFIQFVDLLEYAIHVPCSSSSTQYKVFDFIYFFVPYLQKEQKETTKEKISNYIVERSSCIQIA